MNQLQSLRVSCANGPHDDDGIEIFSILLVSCANGPHDDGDIENLLLK